MPLGHLSAEQLAEWASLYAAILLAWRETPIFGRNFTGGGNLEKLLSEMNDRVYDLLRIRADQRAVVSDLVDFRMKINEGQTPTEAIRPPSELELKIYARHIRDELDAFTDDQPLLRHRILVGKHGQHGIVSIALEKASSGAIPVEVVDVNNRSDASFKDVELATRTRHNQWCISNVTFVFTKETRLIS